MILSLIIGNKNYSSWSLRPWLVLKYFDIPFEEILVPLYEGDYKSKLLQYAPNGKVPALMDGKQCIWESLAIAEYLADLFPDKNLWPQETKNRAWARSISAEMHAGFSSLRSQMPMNLKKHFADRPITPDVQNDIDRIFAIWKECRETFKSTGPFLFGQFTIADAMFAPVVTRFKTYNVKLTELLDEYAQTILNLPAMKEWYEAGIKETWIIPGAEVN